MVSMDDNVDCLTGDRIVNTMVLVLQRYIFNIRPMISLLLITFDRFKSLMQSITQLRPVFTILSIINIIQI